MFAKLAIICTLAAVASAISPGYLSSAYALGSQAEHTVHGYGGLASVSKQAKAVDSAYATVRKSDIRLTNDANAYAHPHPITHTTTTYGHAFGAPALAHGYAAAPATIAHGYHSPSGTITYGHGYAPTTLTHGYAAAPTLSQHGYLTGPTTTLSHHGFAGPSTLSHHGFAAPNTLSHHGFAGPSTLSHHGYVSGPTTTLAHRYPTTSLGYSTQGGPIATAPVTKRVAVPVPTGGLGVSYSPATAVAHSTFSGYGIHYGY